MNALTVAPQYHAQLPVFLQKPELFAESNKAIAGIGGGSPPQIGIRAAKWRLVSADGEELMVNQMHLDVIVLTGNPHVSKTFYEGAYDANVSSPPTCFSDNGVGPSSQAGSPQSPLCASCPNNVWGSKINEATGKGSKKCGDSKKLAVVLAVDTPYITSTNAAGVAKALEQVYMLRVPTMSMRSWADYAKSIIGRGVPVIGCVTRMQFDPKTSYPAILFQAVGFVTEPVYNASSALLMKPEVADYIGANDTPTAVQAQIAGPVPQHLTPTPPVVPTPVMQPTPAPLPPTPTLQGPAPVAAPAPAELPRRQRGRPAAAAPIAPAPAPAPVPAQPAPMFASPAAPSAPVIQAPTAADASLDALLAQILGPQV